MEMSVTSKAELRKEVLERRKHLSNEQKKEWDQAVFMQLKKLSCLQNANTVYSYVSVRGEAGTEEVFSWLRRQGIRVALPRVQGTDMSFYYCDSEADLEPGAFGIPEPGAHCKKAEVSDAPVLVPGVVFSSGMQRIGYGAGYYDRFFAKEPQHKKIGLCYTFQLVSAFAAEKTDIPMDGIVTEAGVIKL